MATIEPAILPTSPATGPRRLVFLGTPAAAVPALRAVVAVGHRVVLVVSRADARRGRGGEATPSPVKEVAVAMGLEVTDRVEEVVGCGAELGVVVAYGRLIRPPVLAAVPMVNLHFSLLPRWRGAAPVERAILAGDTETGVCVMGLEAGLDTGPVHRRATVGIGPDDTATGLRHRLADLGAELLVGALAAGLGPGDPQTGEVTYAAKVESSDLRLDWTSTAVGAHRVVRVGRAWTTWRGRRLLVIDAAAVPAPFGGGGPGTLVDDVVTCGEGGLRLLSVQPEGRRPVDGGDWVRGARPEAGEALGR